MFLILHHTRISTPVSTPCKKICLDTPAFFVTFHPLSSTESNLSTFLILSMLDYCLTNDDVYFNCNIFLHKFSKYISSCHTNWKVFIMISMPDNLVNLYSQAKQLIVIADVTGFIVCLSNAS